MFQVKVMLIVLGLANALILGRMAVLIEAGIVNPNVPLSKSVRLAAGLSRATWLTVAAAGRLIAYV